MSNDGNLYEYKFIGGVINDVPSELLNELKQFKKIVNIPKRSVINKKIFYESNNDISSKKNDIENLVFKLPQKYCDNYDDWIKIGFIIFNELGSDGFDLFNKWSSQSDKYDFNDVFSKYNSFQHKNNGLTIASLHKFLNNNDVNHSDYNILLNFTTGDNADYFKFKYNDKFVFSSGILYYFNGVYFKTDDNKYSYLNNFINDIYFFDIFKLYQQYEIDELKKFNNNINDKKNISSHLDSIKKKIFGLKNHKIRKVFIDDIICKITNNDIKWNQYTNFFTFENKIFDINLNKFIIPQSNFFINISCGWSFDDNYDHNLISELDNFIDTIHTDKDIKNLYLTILSTGLSGQTLEKFVIANGSGGNGKGVINELALDTFGNYAYILPSSILSQPLKIGSCPELANLNFKRFVIIREPDDDFKINSSIIKELTGGKDINARLIHSNDTKTTLNLTLIMECNQKPKLSDTSGMHRRIIDIPFSSSFIDKSSFNKLDDEFKSNTFISNTFFKTFEFRNKFKQAFFILLTKFYSIYHIDNSLFLPKIIEDRSFNYISDSDDIFIIFNDILDKTNNSSDFVKIKDLFDSAKNSDIYFNMTKEQKRFFSYKHFCSKLDNNIFFKHFVSINSDKIKILKCHKFKSI